MSMVKEEQITEACTILFGEDFLAEKATIDYLQPEGIKHAFREKAKECHPDISGGNNPEMQENFLKLKDAYDFLLSAKKEPVPTENNTKTADIPNRKLRLGEFLYYSGKISWKELISAITWQKQNLHNNKNILFGIYFIKKGILTTSELGFSVFKLKIHNSNY